MKAEQHVFEWLASVQYQARCFGGAGELIRLRAQVVDGCVELYVLTRHVKLCKAPPRWFMFSCTGEWSERIARRSEQGVTWDRYSCLLDPETFEAVLVRFVRRAPARRQQKAAELRRDLQRAQMDEVQS
jgi:hypothetical protein